MAKPEDFTSDEQDAVAVKPERQKEPLIGGPFRVLLSSNSGPVLWAAVKDFLKIVGERVGQTQL